MKLRIHGRLLSVNRNNSIHIRYLVNQGVQVVGVLHEKGNFTIEDSIMTVKAQIFHIYTQLFRNYARDFVHDADVINPFKVQVCEECNFFIVRPSGMHNPL